MSGNVYCYCEETEPIKKRKTTINMYFELDRLDKVRT